MGSVAGKFDAHYEALAGELKKIVTEGEDVLSKWKGQASGGFSTALDSVGTAWGHVNNALTDIATKIQQSGVHYDSTDADGHKQLAAVDATSISSILSGTGLG
jgi:WXG100 family type VII secretion target